MLRDTLPHYSDHCFHQHNVLCFPNSVAHPFLIPLKTCISHTFFHVKPATFFHVSLIYTVPSKNAIWTVSMILHMSTDVTLAPIDSSSSCLSHIVSQLSISTIFSLCGAHPKSHSPHPPQGPTELPLSLTHLAYTTCHAKLLSS